MLVLDCVNYHGYRIDIAADEVPGDPLTDWVVGDVVEYLICDPEGIAVHQAEDLCTTNGRYDTSSALLGECRAIIDADIANVAAVLA